MDLVIELLHSEAKVPKKAHDTDACYDLVAVSKEEKDGFIQYGVGFALEIPKGYAGYIYPRSSISKTGLIMCNSPGVIDSGYRNEIAVRFKYLGIGSVYQVGERIAQLEIRELQDVSFLVSKVRKDTERGLGGFGSTGK